MKILYAFVPLKSLGVHNMLYCGQVITSDNGDCS